MIQSNKRYFILIYFLFYQNLFAYLDPGTWSYVLQILMVVFIGGIVAIKTFWKNIVTTIRNIFKKK